MVFPIDKRVITHYCAGDPLIKGESHFTASFGGSWFRNCNCKFYSSNCSNGSYQTNKTDLSPKDQNGKDNHLIGVQLHQGRLTGHQFCLQGQVHRGIPLTKVCLECIHCNLKEYTDRRCRRLTYTHNTYTHNTLNNLNDTHVGEVRDLTVQVL